jgi:AcrR family transcriptional regulator
MSTPRNPPPESRRDKALATRRRMLAAAYELVCERGYAATTIGAIAKRAGVATQTVHYTFRTKGAILREVFHAMVVGVDAWSPTLDAEVHDDHAATLETRFPWFPAFVAEPDGTRALGIYVGATVQILERIAPLVAATSGTADAEVRVVRAQSERLRTDAAGMMVVALAAKRPLRPGLTVARAVDLFLLFTSAEVFQQLHGERGWTSDDVQTWLVGVLAEQLFGLAA